MELVVAALVGLVAGFLGTLLGIGGGTLMVPLMVLAGVDARVAVPASLVAIMGTSLGGLQYLLAKGFVRVKLAFILEAASITGALLGVMIFGRLTSGEIVASLGVALVIIGVVFLLRHRLLERGASRPSAARLFVSLAASLAAGVASATLGIGGGVVKVPILVLALGLPVKVAVSTSKLMVGVTALAGVIGHGVLGRVDWPLALSLLAGTYTGGTLASRLLPRLESRFIYVLASSYYFIVGGYMVVKGLALL